MSEPPEGTPDDAADPTSAAAPEVPDTTDEVSEITEPTPVPAPVPTPEPPPAPPSPPRIRPAGRARVAAAQAAAAVLVLLGGYAVADAADVVPGVLTTTPARQAPQTVTAPGALVEATAPTALPDLASAAPQPDPAVLAATLTPLLAAPALRGSAAASVVDARSGAVLLDAGAAQAREPASVAKLLTAAAAFHTLGPDATLPTRVVSGADGSVVLVGGGDQLLGPDAGDPTAVVGHAGLADLADQTASALTAQGRTSVTVLLDDTLTGGSPQVEAGWGSGDIAAGFVAPLTSVALDAGRRTPARYAQRSADPALDVVQRFAQLLAARGVSVTGAPQRTTGPVAAGAAVLGEVRSAPLSDVVAEALAESDNTVAEGLARLVGAASGRPPGFADSAQAVLDAVRAAGVDTTGAVLADGSGLGSGSQVPPAVFTNLLRAAATGPGLAPLTAAMPVGGLSGTLAERFTENGTPAAAAGLVRAKTGSLTGVTSLVGSVVDADGRLLVFAVLADGAGPTDPARDAVDAVVETIAACGCR